MSLHDNGEDCVDVKCLFCRIWKIYLNIDVSACSCPHLNISNIKSIKHNEFKCQSYLLGEKPSIFSNLGDDCETYHICGDAIIRSPVFFCHIWKHQHVPLKQNLIMLIWERMMFTMMLIWETMLIWERMVDLPCKPKFALGGVCCSAASTRSLEVVLWRILILTKKFTWWRISRGVASQLNSTALKSNYRPE